MVEIERRWLLKGSPIYALSDLNIKSLNITQIYLQNGARIRKAEGEETKYYVTTKTSIADSFAMNEEEYEIDLDTYNAHMKNEFYVNGCMRVIKKTRTIVPYGDGILKWEIDSFIVPNKMCIIEIEIPHEDFHVELPEWIKPFVVMEVTGIKEFANYNLAVKSVNLNTN